MSPCHAAGTNTAARFAWSNPDSTNIDRTPPRAGRAGSAGGQQFTPNIASFADFKRSVCEKRPGRRVAADFSKHLIHQLVKARALSPAGRSTLPDTGRGNRREEKRSVTRPIRGATNKIQLAPVTTILQEIGRKRLRPYLLVLPRRAPGIREIFWPDFLPRRRQKTGRTSGARIKPSRQAGAVWKVADESTSETHLLARLTCRTPVQPGLDGRRKMATLGSQGSDVT
ncbi:hypothetical protein Bbelb_092510 [Branchiostoma belcheri]|nr:hypothetical protein Bbelb_092510 [Branchiostoma belcheri]